MNTKVSFGWASIIGYAGAFAAALIAVVEALEADGQTPGSVKWLAIISAALAGWTNHNRSTQAAAITLPPIAPLPPAGQPAGKVKAPAKSKAA